MQAPHPRQNKIRTAGIGQKACNRWSLRMDDWFKAGRYFFKSPDFGPDRDTAACLPRQCRAATTFSHRTFRKNHNFVALA
jgi:hypothetical protein